MIWVFGVFGIFGFREFSEFNKFLMDWRAERGFLDGGYEGKWKWR